MSGAQILQRQVDAADRACFRAQCALSSAKWRGDATRIRDCARTLAALEAQRRELYAALLHLAQPSVAASAIAA